MASSARPAHEEGLSGRPSDLSQYSLLLYKVLCNEFPQIAKEWVLHPEGKERNP